ncbi:MAG TPA: NAD(P)-dependent oxidoreductase [Acidimicrobiales bacterium]|nr:NAD(P)-dependent oxidoreductase [Acidimicrobiales bacterium]
MTARPRALVTAPVRGPGLELLGELAELVVDPWIDHDPIRIYGADQLAERAASEEASILVVEADMCSGPVLELPLMALASCRGDPTNVDVPAATAAGIPVLRAPGRNADAVAELAVALLLSATRGTNRAEEDVRSDQVYKDGTIPYQRYRGWQIAGRTAGLVGLGAVGRALRWRLEGLGMRVIAFDPYAQDATCSLEQLLESSDVVSMHAPVTEETKGMIGQAEFDSMRDGVIFLNTARAQLHDSDALVDALRSGKVAAAGLDHFVGEHLAADDPLLGFPNAVLTPHIGGATYDTEANHTSAIAEDLCRLLAGATPRNIVNPEVLSSKRRPAAAVSDAGEKENEVDEKVKG